MKIEIGKMYKYAFDNKQGHNEATIEIIRQLRDGGGYEVKFIDVKEDNTGNGLFNYLLKTGKTMNVSACYLCDYKTVRFVRGYHKKNETMIERLQNSKRVEVTYVSKAPQNYMRIQDPKEEL